MEYCRGINEHEPTEELTLYMRRLARVVFRDWTQSLKTQGLTPEQEMLRDKLERFGVFHSLDFVR